jgi:hypothetical protein
VLFCVAVFSIVSVLDGLRNRGIRLPVIPSPPAWAVME